MNMHITTQSYANKAAFSGETLANMGKASLECEMFVL
jgi:hypothetical protein